MTEFKTRPLEDQVRDNLIVKAYAGSHSYGTNIATSDVDYRGIFMADEIHRLTPFFPIEEFDDAREEDTKYYEIDKYMKLYMDGNPNILELLWVDRQDVVYSTPQYELMREYGPALLSSKVAFTFTGYACAQMKRIKGHNKWISNPRPIDPPRQIDFVSLVHNFTDQKLFKINLADFKDDYRLIPYDGNLFGLYAAPGYQTFDDKFLLNTVYDPSERAFTDEAGNRRMPLFIVKFNKDVYDREKDEWGNYWRWKNNRNKKRSELEELYQFDTKHAMHLCRLMRMGAEILRGEGVIVRRPDAQELLGIRNGSMTYEEIVQYSEEMDQLIRGKLYRETKLPKKPNMRLAVELLMKLKRGM